MKNKSEVIYQHYHYDEILDQIKELYAKKQYHKCIRITK